MKKPVKYQRKRINDIYREGNWPQLVAGEGIRQRAKRNRMYNKAMDMNIKILNPRIRWEME